MKAHGTKNKAMNFDRHLMAMYLRMWSVLCYDTTRANHSSPTPPRPKLSLHALPAASTHEGGDGLKRHTDPPAVVGVLESIIDPERDLVHEYRNLSFVLDFPEHHDTINVITTSL